VRGDAEEGMLGNGSGFRMMLRRERHRNLEPGLRMAGKTETRNPA
jgi:hypothetical protein